MNIKQTIITATVALTMVAMIAPMTVGATTISDLQAQISALMAQLNSMQGSTSTTTTSGSLPADCVGVTFSRNLKVGMSGQDVKCLQVVLNMSASTQVSVSGAGSPGMESMYFGPKTLAAVMKWQAQQGWTPASQVGPLSRAKLNAWLAGTSSTTTTTTTTTGGLPAGCTSSVGFSATTGVSCATGTTVVSTGPVNVMLSSDNPVANSIVGGQATADLLHMTFTGTGVVTSVTLQRSGISDQNTLSNVYLYEGNTRITDGYSFNISGQIVINGLSINVAGSQEISVRGDVSTNAPNNASTIAVSLTSYTANGTTVSANVTGNTMAIVNGNLASATIGTQTDPSTASVNAGTTQYSLWSAPVQVNVRSVLLKAANFREIGSAPSNSLANMNLFVDGINTGAVGTTSVINGSTYVMFDLTASPATLATGSHTLEVRADIIAGSGRTIQLSVQQAADLMIEDPQIGVNVAVSGTPNAGGTITINPGSSTVTIDPTFNATTNISGGATNAVIGDFDFSGYGENVKVNELELTPVFTGQSTTYVAGTVTAAVSGVTIQVASTAGFTAGNIITIAGVTQATATVTSITDSTHMVVTITTVGATPSGAVTVVNEGLNNVTLYFNGSQIGTQQNWPSTGGDLVFQLGSQMIIPAGQTSTLQVRADLQSTSDVSYTGGTVSVNLNEYAGTGNNAQGQTSQTTVSVPITDVPGHQVTLQSGLLAVSKNTAYLNQAVTPNTSGVQIGSYILQNQSTSESIRLTSYKFVTYADTSMTPSTQGSVINGINDLSGFRTSDTTGSGSTPIQPNGTSDVFSINDTLAPGASMVLNVFANTGSSTTIYVQTNLTVASIGVTDNIATTSSQVAGQIMSLSNGQVTNPPTIVPSATTQSQYISAAGGASNASQAEFNFAATGGTATITELKFTVSDSTATGYNSVTSICVTPNTGAPICQQPVSGTADITGLSLMVPNGSGGLYQPISVSYTNTSATTGAPSGTVSRVSLSYVKYTSGGTMASFSPTPTPVNAYNLTLVGSQPIVTLAGVPNPTTQKLSAGTQAVAYVTVQAASNGPVNINSLAFTFTGNAAGTHISPSTAFVIKDQSGSTINNFVVGDGSTNGGAAVTGNGSAAATAVAIFTGGYPIQAGKSVTFEVDVNVSALAGSNSGDSVAVGLVRANTGTLGGNSVNGFAWTDTAGGGATAAQTGTLITGFPTNTVSITTN